MGMLDGIYFNTFFWIVFSIAGIIAMLLMKLNKLKLIQIVTASIFWVMFLLLFAAMIHHETNISSFLKKVEVNLVEANVNSKQALSEGKDITFGVQVSLVDGSKYLISDVDHDKRTIKLYEKNSTDADKVDTVKLKKIVYGGYKLSQVELSDEEKGMALKKSKRIRSKQPMK